MCIRDRHGCCQIGSDMSQTERTLAGFGKNPNVGAVLVVGLGCDGIQAGSLAEDIAQTGKPVKHLVIQEQHGTLNTISEGGKILRELAQKISGQEREEFDISHLTVADVYKRQFVPC